MVRRRDQLLWFPANSAILYLMLPLVLRFFYAIQLRSMRKRQRERGEAVGPRTNMEQNKVIFSFPMHTPSGIHKTLEAPHLREDEAAMCEGKTNHLSY